MVKKFTLSKREFFFYLLFFLTYLFYIKIITLEQSPKDIIRFHLFLFYILILLFSFNPVYFFLYSLPFILTFSIRIWIKPYNIPLQIYISDFLTPIFFLFFISLLLTGNKLKHSKVVALLILYGIWGGLSTLCAKNKDFSLIYTFLIFSNIIYLVIGIYFIDTKDKLFFFLKLWIFVWVFNIIIALCQKIFGYFPIFNIWTLQKISIVWGGRVKGIFTHSNSLSAFLSLVSVICIGILMDRKYKKFNKLFFYFLISFSFIVILLSYSRTGYISIILIIYLFLFFEAYRRGKLLYFMKYTLLFIFILCTAFLILNIFAENIFLRFKSILWFKRDSSILLRFYYWKKCFDLFLKYPFTGIGFGQFPFQPFALHPHAHNLFFQISAELGFPGIIIMFCVFFVLLKELFNKIRTKQNNYYIYCALLIGWIVIITVHMNFDFFYLSINQNTENKIFFTYLLVTLKFLEFY